jgi:hypothetical protein
MCDCVVDNLIRLLDKEIAQFVNDGTAYVQHILYTMHHT